MPLKNSDYAQSLDEVNLVLIAHRAVIRDFLAHGAIDPMRIHEHMREALGGNTDLLARASHFATLAIRENPFDEV